MVYETKVGENLTTHEILKYSSIALKIKSIFPHCRYYLLVSGGRKLKEETLIRHGKGFDNVFLNWGRDKEKIWKTTEEQLKISKQKKIIWCFVWLK
jgi:hypothetical protein